AAGRSSDGSGAAAGAAVAHGSRLTVGALGALADVRGEDLVEAQPDARADRLAALIQGAHRGETVGAGDDAARLVEVLPVVGAHHAGGERIGGHVAVRRGPAPVYHGGARGARRGAGRGLQLLLRGPPLLHHPLLSPPA